MLQSYVFKDRDQPIDAPSTLDGNELLKIGYKDIGSAIDEVLQDLSF